MDFYLFVGWISILYFRFEMSAIVKRANLDSTIKICHCSSDFTLPCCHCSFVYHFFQSLDVLEGRRYIIVSIVTQNQQSTVSWQSLISTTTDQSVWKPLMEWVWY